MIIEFYESKLTWHKQFPVTWILGLSEISSRVVKRLLTTPRRRRQLPTHLKGDKIKDFTENNYVKIVFKMNFKVQF